MSLLYPISSFSLLAVRGAITTTGPVSGGPVRVTGRLLSSASLRVWSREAMARLAALLLLPVLIESVFSISFFLPVNSRKCLREEIHKDVLVTGEYEIGEQPNTKTNLKVSVAQRRRRPLRSAASLAQRLARDKAGTPPFCPCFQIMCVNSIQFDCTCL